MSEQLKNRIDFFHAEEAGEVISVDDSGVKLCLLAEKNEGTIYKCLMKIKEVTHAIEKFTFTEIIEDADIILIYMKTETWGWNTIKTLRSQPNHFLKPMMLISNEPFENIDALADSTLCWPFSHLTILEKLNNFFKILEKLNGLPELPDSLGENSLKKTLILRYLYSRESYALQPRRNFQASVGYTFPLVQLLFKVSQGKEVGFIDALKEAQLLESKLIDKLNVCPHCEHTQINFRELCPICRSLNISEDVTIHHFRCAFVGKESEFRRGLTLVCPKCSRELRHIGVDYDKPSEVLWCNDCKHNFSEPLLSCFCLVCAKIFAPEDAFIKEISECTLSQEGQRAAEEGVLPGSGLISILKKEMGFYKKEVFLEYLRIETFRCRRYKYDSTLARLNLKGADEAFGLEVLKRSRKLRNDFATVLNQTFRTTDLFTDLANGEILIIFTNTDSKNAKIAFERLKVSLSKISQKDLNLEYTLFDLTEIDNLDEIWERFN